MNTALILKRSWYWSHYLAVRWQLLLMVAVLWLSASWLKSHYGQEDSNLWLVMNQFLALTRWTVIGLFLASLLSALTTWAFFVYQVKNRKITLKTEFGEEHRAEAGDVPLSIILQGNVIRPFLGTVRAQLVFKEMKLSDTVILDGNVRKKKSLWRKGIGGTGKTLLHDRGIYDVEKVRVRFCDMFSIVSLPYTLPFIQQVYTLPRELQSSQIKAQPNTTEEQTHRVEIPRRVEGEYINYKEFETGDNIRRIVWKIYAKSGELVVRIPETKDPYASHLYFYPSFFYGIEPGVFSTELLNVYKDRIRNIFEALLKNGYQVRVPDDQEVPKLPGMSDKHIELFQITAAVWQNQKPPVSFVEASKAAFVALSSLTPADELATLLNHLPQHVPVVVVKMSEAIASPFKINVKDIFFRPQDDPIDTLRGPFLLSPLRVKLKKNENDMANLLRTRGNGGLINSVDAA